MAKKLTKLPKTQFSGLDYQNIIEDVVSLVTENPEYNEQWDDFLSSNAGRMMTEMFAYIADQLATRVDWVVNENYLGTATQKGSVIKILKLLGYNFDLPIASNVSVTMEVNQPVGTFFLTPVYDNSGEFVPYTLNAEDRNGVMRTFEALNYNEEASTYDYRGGVRVQTGDDENPNTTHYIDFYEGKTFIEEFTANTSNNPIFHLSRSPVIDGSIQVYQVSEEGGSVTETRLNEVNSFLDPKAQNDADEFGNTLPLAYKRKVEENDTVSVEFAPTTLISEPNRRLRQGDTVRIFYRTGGGVDGNITARSINVDKTLAVNGNSVNTHFVNESKGTGGRDGETAEHASVYAPMSIRTAGKTVTEEDYNIIINSLNTVVKAKSFANNNIAPSTVYEKYGVFIHPLEVWHFILKDKPGWEDIPPSRYNDFQWISLRLENRFNEALSFRDGEFGKEVLSYSSNLEREITLDWDGDEEDETFYNYNIIETPSKFKDNLLIDGNPNPDFLFKLTEKDIGVNYFHSLYTYNVFQEMDTTNNGLIEGSTPVWTVSQRVPAKLKSEVNLANGIDLSSKYLLSVGIDNNPIIADIDVRGSNPSETSAQEIADIINSTFTSNPDYNNGSSGDKGYQEFGLSVDSSVDAGLSDDEKYAIVVNGYEKTITTGTSTTYSEVASLLQDSLKFEIVGNINGQSSVINEIHYDVEQLEIGMSVEGYSIPAGTTIIDVSIPDNTITISNAATLTSKNEVITLSGYSVTIEGSSPTEDIRVTNIGYFPKHSVRLEAGISENDLLTALSTSLEAPNTGSGKPGFQYAGLSVDLATISPLSNSTDYYFKINNYEYSITTGTDDTYNDIITLLDTALDPNYTVSSSGSTGTDDIIFTNDTNASVYLEAGESGNDLFEGLHETSDYSLGSFEGGGDYSEISKVVTHSNELYLQIKSPLKGETSFVVFEQTSDSALNALKLIFNIDIETVISDIRTMRGMRSLTVIINESSENFGKLILENGSINYSKEQMNFYLNYLINDKDSIDIGRYHNENFEETDPAWRQVATRIYNTVYDKNRNTVDLNASNFYVKMTKDPVKESPIYALENSWELQESSNAVAETVLNPQEQIDPSNYYISLKFDDKPVVENIDVTGDGFTATSYTIVDLINNINNTIRNHSDYSSDFLYADFRYATSNETGDKIIITSPLKNNMSRVEIHPSIVNDCMEEMFDLDESTSHTFYPQGDYFIDYDDSRDIMTLNKFNIGRDSNIPDLQFYFHYLFDKRITEGIFDGEEGRPGFPDGTIDEDIYEAELSNYKITGLNHVYKQSSFSTFDIKGVIYYNKIYSAEDVQNRVEENLRQNFNLSNIDYGDPIPKSKILSIIHESDGVDYIILDYLGPDSQEPGTSVENAIETDFNQIVLLSEDRFFGGQKVHGIIFDYVISG